MRGASAPRGVHRAERPRGDQLRDRSGRGLLGAFAGGVHHAGDRLDVLGLGGFQETEQLPIFSKITKYQGQ